MAVILCQEEERKRLKEVQKKTELGYVDMLSMRGFEKQQAIHFFQTAAFAPAQGSDEKEEPADSRSTGMSLNRYLTLSVYVLY